MRPVGQGTERVEDRLQELFPNAALVRVDRDVVRGQEQMDAPCTVSTAVRHASWWAPR